MELLKSKTEKNDDPIICGLIPSAWLPRMLIKLFANSSLAHGLITYEHQ